MAEKQTRGKGEGAIFQRNPPHGLWVARIELPSAPGKRRRKEITAKTKDLLLQKLAEPRKQFYIHGDLPSASQSLETWLTYWLDNVAVKRVRPNTFAGYRSVINRQIIPSIGKIRLDKMKPAHIRRLHDDVLATGATSTYALNAHRILAKALTDAQSEGLMMTNPAKLTDAPRKDRPDLNALTVAEAIAVIRWTVPELDGESETYNHDPVRWATYLLTGMRRGELLGLEVDRITDVIDLSWQLQRITDVSRAPRDYEYREIVNGLYWTRPKSSAGWRIIPLVDPLKTILERHLERAEPNPYGLVFTKGGLPIDPDTESSAWPAWLTASQISPKKVRLHDLRHTTVDLLLEAGVPEDVVMEIVGHSVRTVTRGYKSRTNLVRRTEAMKQLSALLTAD